MTNRPDCDVLDCSYSATFKVQTAEDIIFMACESCKEDRFGGDQEGIADVERL